MNEFAYNDVDLFESLGIAEEWEEQEENSDPYAELDAKTLKEYGF
jgi:hypothetical protein